MLEVEGSRPRALGSEHWLATKFAVLSRGHFIFNQLMNLGEHGIHGFALRDVEGVDVFVVNNLSGSSGVLLLQLLGLVLLAVLIS